MPPRNLPQLVLVLAALPYAVPAQSFQPVPTPLGIQGVPLATGDLGRPVCVADFDGDGDVDVILPYQVGGPLAFYRNDGGMVFTDRTAAAGLGSCTEPKCMLAGDIDNDGDADLFIGNDSLPCQLFVNDGTGTFSEQAAARGLLNSASNYAASFGDYDRDGWLDLYLGNRSAAGSGSLAPNRLYKNTGNGFFQDVTATAGVGDLRPALAVTFMDYDEDMWPDILLVNDKGTSFGPNELYRNNGDGTFTAVAAQVGANAAIDGMGVDFVDVFADGGVDFYCSDLPYDHLFELWNPTTGVYEDATATYGLEGGGVGWAVHWLDYDNDGWQDLHVVQMVSPNLLFRNPGQPCAAQTPWTDEAAAVGLAFTRYQYTAAVADFDDDGRVDLLERFDAGGAPILTAPSGVIILGNQCLAGNWLKFRPRGTVGNRDGFGARIEVVTGTLHQRQWVRSGIGYLSNSDRRVHFGLGAATHADRVIVTWPSGQVQHLTNVPANQIVELVEPSMRLAAPAQLGGTTSLEVSIPGDEGLACFLMLSFATSPALSLPGGTLPIAFDDLTALSLSAGNPILPGFFAVLDPSGQASSPLVIPPLPWLAGLTFYATAATVDVPTFPLVRTVFPRAVAITVQ